MVKHIIRSKLHILPTVTWVRKRANRSSLDYYQNSPEQLIELSDIVELFKAFDEDNNGYLDVTELHEMFVTAGTDVPKAIFTKMFA